MSAIIEIKAGRYFSVMYFVPGDKVDWMLALWRDPTVDDGRWHIVYRFRYYAGADAWDRQDRKSVTEATANVEIPEEAALEQCAKLAAEVSRMFGDAEVHKLLLRTDDPETIMAALSHEDWAHAKYGAEAEQALAEMGKSDAPE